MVNAVDDPVVLTDAGNDIIMQNRRAETVFRVKPATARASATRSP